MVSYVFSGLFIMPMVLEIVFAILVIMFVSNLEACLS